MSASSVNKPLVRLKKPRQKIDWRYVIGLPAQVLLSFVAANVIVVIGLLMLQAVGVSFTTESAVFNAILAALVYILTLAMTLGASWVLLRRLSTKKDLGIDRLPSWMDIILSPAGAVVYLLLSGIAITLFSVFFPQIDLQQSQEIGFQNLSGYSQYLLAFVTLVVVAPVAEEVLFRGYLYGKLRKHAPVWLGALIASGLFALAHGQWNVAIDTFVLSLVMCSLREVTGSIWAGTLLHMLKNGLAFYFLFINPSLLGTL